MKAAFVMLCQYFDVGSRAIVAQHCCVAFFSERDYYSDDCTRELKDELREENPISVFINSIEQPIRPDDKR